MGPWGRLMIIIMASLGFLVISLLGVVGECDLCGDIMCDKKNFRRVFRVPDGVVNNLSQLHFFRYQALLIKLRWIPVFAVTAEGKR